MPLAVAACAAAVALPGATGHAEADPWALFYCRP
jgi:hypothetical protein